MGMACAICRAVCYWWCAWAFMWICVSKDLLKVNISQPGLYPLISVAWLFMVFGLSALLGGNGYLSIYIAGIMTNRFAFPYKSHIIAFHDAVAWMMQIVVFLVLGLLVFPSQLPGVALQALALVFVLMFVARPLVSLSRLQRVVMIIEKNLYLLGWFAWSRAYYFSDLSFCLSFRAGSTYF